MVCDRLRKTLSRWPSTSSSTTSNGIPAAVRLRVAASSASRRGSVERLVAMAPVLPRRRRSVPPAPPRDEHRDPDEGDHDEHDEEHAPTLGPRQPALQAAALVLITMSRRCIRRCSLVIHPNTRGPGAGRGQEGQAQSGDAEASGAIVGRGPGELDSPGGARESAGAEVHHDRPGPLRADDARGGAGTRRGRRAVGVGVDPADRGGGTGSRGGRRARCRCRAARARHRAGRPLAALTLRRARGCARRARACVLARVTNGFREFSLGFTCAMHATPVGSRAVKRAPTGDRRRGQFVPVSTVRSGGRRRDAPDGRC